MTYALAIYHLNLLLAFLTPKIDPAMAELEAEDEEGMELPTRQSDEFRPFIRRLPGKQIPNTVTIRIPAIWIITLVWCLSGTRLQTNVLGRTPVSFTDPLVTAGFNPPVFYKDVLRLVPFKCTLISITSSLGNKKIQICFNLEIAAS